MALAVIPSLMSSFFLSYAPACSRPQSETVTSETVWTLCKPFLQPLSPPVEGLLAAVASESLSKVSFQISSPEGPRSRSIPNSEDESRNWEHQEPTAQKPPPACGVSAYRPVARAAPVHPQQRKAPLAFLPKASRPPTSPLPLAI